MGNNALIFKEASASSLAKAIVAAATIPTTIQLPEGAVVALVNEPLPEDLEYDVIETMDFWNDIEGLFRNNVKFVTVGQIPSEVFEIPQGVSLSYTDGIGLESGDYVVFVGGETQTLVKLSTSASFAAN